LSKGLLATLAGFLCLWIVLDRTASALGSVRGEAGLVVCAAVLAAAVVVEFAIARRTPRQALATLGLRAPGAPVLLWTIALCLALLCFFPFFALATQTYIGFRPDAALLAIGMFAQGGIAEEVVFRGFLFRRFREKHSFWRAAFYSAIPFTAVHALLFLSFDFPVALASLLVAVSLSFPLTWLFERGGNSVWLPAIVHAVVQASIKLVVVEEAAFQTMAIGWMAISAIAPWLLFALRPDGTIPLRPGGSGVPDARSPG
jgi:membrane protease YdiL (CAAX protease family)